MIRLRTWLGPLSAVALLATSNEARAEDPTKDQCITANETGQSLRQSGKLRAARMQLLVCVDKACPDLVRDDCSERLDELDRLIPTIVFSAKGAADADLAAVNVTMDGAPFAERLDGTAIAVDPGQHTFVFSADGYPAQTKVLIIGEGAKGRQEEISFAPDAPPAAPAATGGTPPLPGVPPPDQPADGSTQRTVAYVLGGAGVLALGLGAYFGLRAQSTYDDASSHCPTGSGSCDPDGVTLGKDAHDQAAISTVGFIAGGALIAGGVALFFTASPGPARASASRSARGVRLRPTASATGAGLGIGGTW